MLIVRIVRPAILTNGPELGTEKVRVGWEWGVKTEAKEEREKALGPAVGWSISRKDVGVWVYKNLVAEEGKRWEGKCVSLVY